MSKTTDEFNLLTELGVLFIRTTQVLEDIINIRGTTVSSPLLGGKAAFICNDEKDREFVEYMTNFIHDFEKKSLELLEYVSSHKVEDD